MSDRLEDAMAEVHDTARALAELLAEQRPPEDRVRFPPIPGVRPDEDEIVDAADALIATLGAVAGATGRLAGSGVNLATNDKPLTFQYAGELVGFSPETGEIRIAVTPQGKARDKESTDAQTK